MTTTRGGGGRRVAGRYVTYSAKVVRQVCEDLAAGKTWEQVAELEGRPSYATLYNWRRKYPEFDEATEAARAYGGDACADRALRVASEATKESVPQDRLHVDVLMQRAAFLAPSRWSGKGGAAAAARPAPTEVIFRVRHFEKVVGADGRTVLREIKPEGEA